MDGRALRLKGGVVAGMKSGLRSFLWMARVVVPVSLIVAILQWSGWLSVVDKYLGPLMGLLGLPPQAALPLLSGMVVNIYAVIGALAVMSFSVGQMTIIAVFSLICHNLILEGIIQHRSGFNAVRATLLRFSVGAITAFVVSRFFVETTTGSDVLVHEAARPGFVMMLKNWSLDTGETLVKIFIIIVFIMMILEISRKMGWIDSLLKVFRPVLRVFGTAESTATMFVAGILFGILYGGAIIVEESKSGHLGREDKDDLQTSLGINHAMIEDPALFATLGVNLLWLLVPRLLAAVLTVHGIRLARKAFKRA